MVANRHTLKVWVKTLQWFKSYIYLKMLIKSASIRKIQTARWQDTCWDHKNIKVLALGGLYSALLALLSQNPASMGQCLLTQKTPTKDLLIPT
jgi:hypothetical protein